MLLECLLDSADRRAGNLAVADPTQRLTYADLVGLTRALRGVIAAEARGELAGLMLPSSAAGLAGLFAALWAGKVPVPLNFLLQPRELEAVLKDSGLDLVLSTRHFEPLLSHVSARVIYLEDLPLKQLLADQRSAPPPPIPRASPDDIACILYTSGTTGRPKGVCLTQNNLASNCRAAIQHMRLSADDRLLGVVPPFHVFGLSVLHFLPVILGASVTYIPRFSPQAMYRAIEAEKISVLLAVPSMYGAMARLKELDKSVFQHVGIAASGGEPLPRTIYNLMAERTGVTLVEGYGLTESSPIISVDLPWDHRVGTVGAPLSGVEVQLRDPHGSVLFDSDGVPGRAVAGNSKANPEGELFVRGPLVMKGYYNRPEETSAAIDAGGWLRTGDIVRIDETGCLAITGRAKELIIVAGENVYPREVENVLEEHPAVAEAAVIGRLDGMRGEVVIAFVTLREGRQATDEELRGFCRERLASFKAPREVHIRTELPRGPTGKVLKRQLVSPDQS